MSRSDCDPNDSVLFVGEATESQLPQKDKASELPLASVDEPLTSVGAPLASVGAPLASVSAPLASVGAPVASMDVPLTSAETPLTGVDAKLEHLQNSVGEELWSTFLTRKSLIKRSSRACQWESDGWSGGEDSGGDGETDENERGAESMGDKHSYHEGSSEVTVGNENKCGESETGDIFHKNSVECDAEKSGEHTEGETDENDGGSESMGDIKCRGSVDTSRDVEKYGGPDIDGDRETDENKSGGESAAARNENQRQVSVDAPGDISCQNSVECDVEKCGEQEDRATDENGDCSESREKEMVGTVSTAASSAGAVSTVASAAGVVSTAASAVSMAAGAAGALSTAAGAAGTLLMAAGAVSTVAGAVKTAAGAVGTVLKAAVLGSRVLKLSETDAASGLSSAAQKVVDILNTHEGQTTPTADSGIEDEKFERCENELKLKIGNFRVDMIREIKRNYHRPRCYSCRSDATNLSFDYAEDWDTQLNDMRSKKANGGGSVAEKANDDGGGAEEASGDRGGTEKANDDGRRGVTEDAKIISSHELSRSNCQEIASNVSSDIFTDSEANFTVRLPPLIKVEIFSYLSLGDRKVIRLVCKDWCEIAWSRFLCKNDYLKIKEDQLDYNDAIEYDSRNHMQSVLDAFHSSAHNVTSFQLGVPSVRRRDTMFWYHFGQTMLELKLVNCEFRWMDFMRLLGYCTGLQRLEILNSPLLFPSTKVSSEDEEQSQETAADNSVEISNVSDKQEIDQLVLDRYSQLRHNLCYLKVFVVGLDSHCDNLDFLHLIFPPLLDELHISANSSSRSTSDEAKLVSQLLSCLRAKDLHLRFQVRRPILATAVRDMIALALQQHSETKLRTLSLTVWAEKDLYQLLDLHSSSLRSLSLVLGGFITNAGQDTVSAFQNSIARLSNLQCFELDCSGSATSPATTVLSRTVYKELMQLKHLQQVKLIHHRGAPPDSTVLDLLTSKSLRTLYLDTAVNFTVESLVCRPFQSVLSQPLYLTDLHLHRLALHDSVLDMFCRIMPHLRTLAIVGCTLITDQGIAGNTDAENLIGASSSDGISRLNSLTELTLEGPFTETAIQSIKFRELRKLSLVCEPFSADALVELARANPSLEELRFRPLTTPVVNVSYYPHPFSGIVSTPPCRSPRLIPDDSSAVSGGALVDFLRACKRLRHVEGIARFCEDAMRWFADDHSGEKLCPSLRYVDGSLITNE